MTGPYLPDDLESLLNGAIDHGVEGSKVDFKREVSLQGEEFPELLIDLCSIVNTDDEAHFSDYGYLIIGFDRTGNHHGLPEDFDADKLSASLNDKLRHYISPHIDFQVVGPLTHAKGMYAAIQVPPSAQQPHMVTRESSVARPGVWWVRRGDTKVVAGPEDYTRVLRKAVARETAPMREQLHALRGVQEDFTQRLDRALLALNAHTSLPVRDVPDVGTAAKIRAQYGGEDLSVTQALHRDPATFTQGFSNSPPVRSSWQVMTTIAGRQSGLNWSR